MDDEKKFYSTGDTGPTNEQRELANMEAEPALLALGLTSEQIALLKRGGAYFTLEQVADILKAGKAPQSEMDTELAEELKQKIEQVTQLQSQNQGGKRDAEIRKFFKTFI